MGAYEKLRLFAHSHGQHFLVFFGFRRPTRPVHTPVARSHGQHFMEYFGFRPTAHRLRVQAEVEAVPPQSRKRPDRARSRERSARPAWRSERNAFGLASLALAVLAAVGALDVFLRMPSVDVCYLFWLAPFGLVAGLLGRRLDRRKDRARLGVWINLALTIVLALVVVSIVVMFRDPLL